MLIIQDLYIRSGYKYGFSSFIWFDSNALEEFAPNKGRYDTTWYMPQVTYSSGSLGGVSSVSNLSLSIKDSGEITYGDLSSNSLYLRFTAIKFKIQK